MASPPVLLMAEKKEIGREKDIFQLILSFSTQPHLQKHGIEVQFPRNRDEDLKVKMREEVIYTLALGEIDVKRKTDVKVSGKRLIVSVPKLDSQCWLAPGRCSPSRSSSDSS